MGRGKASKKQPTTPPPGGTVLADLPSEVFDSQTQRALGRVSQKFRTSSSTMVEAAKVQFAAFMGARRFEKFRQYFVDVHSGQGGQYIGAPTFQVPMWGEFFVVTIKDPRDTLGNVRSFQIEVYAKGNKKLGHGFVLQFKTQHVIDNDLNVKIICRDPRFVHIAINLMMIVRVLYSYAVRRLVPVYKTKHRPETFIQRIDLEGSVWSREIIQKLWYLLAKYKAQGKITVIPPPKSNVVAIPPPNPNQDAPQNVPPADNAGMKILKREAKLGKHAYRTKAPFSSTQASYVLLNHPKPSQVIQKTAKAWEEIGNSDKNIDWHSKKQK